MDELYKALGVAEDASREEIKKAYRAKAKKYHPDYGGDPSKMALVNLAWEVLKDSSRRKLYDETGSTEENFVETRAKEELTKLFVAMIQNPGVEHMELFVQMEASINSMIIDQKLSIQKADKHITRLEKLRGRIKKGDRFIMILDDLVQEGQQKKHQAEVVIEVADKMKEMLSGCEWEAEERRTKPGPWNPFGAVSIS